MNSSLKTLHSKWRPNDFLLQYIHKNHALCIEECWSQPHRTGRGKSYAKALPIMCRGINFIKGRKELTREPQMVV